jgi:NADPH2:quinone reductase
MRCVILNRFGAPTEVLGPGEQPTPQPGPGQVRIRMIQSPIHNHDLAIVRGIYGTRPPLPAIPGTEAVGVVDEVGPDAANIVMGQRVSVAGVQGAWAEFFLAKAAAAVPVPATLSDDLACQLLAMPLSACMLLEDLDLKTGDWMIQNAASGAVGRLVVALAKERGVNVLGLVRRQQTVAELEAEGVRNVLATEDAAWATRVASLTGGAPVVRALDSVGGKAANDLMNVMAPGGVLTSFGALSGQPLVIDPGSVIFKETTIKGFWGTKRAERTSPADTRRMIVDLIRLATQGLLPLRVAGKFLLADVAHAAAASETPGRAGKIVLRAA